MIMYVNFGLREGDVTLNKRREGGSEGRKEMKEELRALGEAHDKIMEEAAMPRLCLVSLSVAEVTDSYLYALPCRLVGADPLPLLPPSY